MATNADPFEGLSSAGRGRPPSAPMSRPCKTCGRTFQTRCIPRIFRRTDGTETVRWVAQETQCATCQPSLFSGLEGSAHDA